MRNGCPIHPWRFAAPTLALAVATVGDAARAELIDAAVQVRASAAELEAAGFTRAGGGVFVSNPAGECAANGCFDLVGAGGPLEAKGFLEFRFSNYTCTPAYYSGLFAVLDLDLAGATVTHSEFIALVNARTASTGVTAMMAAQAANIQGGLFSDWLPSTLADAVVFQWMPPTAPTGPGLSAIYRFAWDLTDETAFGGPIGVGGAFAVPAPAATALLAIAGMGALRRRR
ncbi:MAG: hypothetical protein GC172_03395 [Phycisphaera sp.]|nr:hypothetical protein [Phycisphaera sp.]